MVKSQYLSLQDAALLVNKSPQTIRRLIKGNKIRYRKYKTPQGFTYLVEKSNLASYFENYNAEEDDDDALEEAELVEDFEPTPPPPRQAAPRPRPPLSQTPHFHEPVFTPSPSMPPSVTSVPVPPQDTYEVQSEEQPQGPFFTASPSPQQNGGPSPAHNNAFPNIVTQLVQQHREDKRRLFELLETFQKRILILEDQIKQLEAPEPAKKRRRFFFF